MPGLPHLSDNGSPTPAYITPVKFCLVECSASGAAAARWEMEVHTPEQKRVKCSGSKELRAELGGNERALPDLGGLVATS